MQPMTQLAERQDLRLGVVNFMNTTPLIFGLEQNAGIELVPNVPSELATLIEGGAVDFALSSSIDYQKSTCPVSVLPVSTLSSNGETFTVKVCSRIPLDQVTEVYCDSDSHTSVVLLQILMQKQFGNTIKVVPVDVKGLHPIHDEWPDTVLMIGDKVVTNNVTQTHPYEADLGEAWKTLTGLPFVFAVWIGHANLPLHKVQQAATLFDRQLRCNKQRIEQVVSNTSDSRGWNRSTALTYLTEHMDYSWTQEHETSLNLFYQYACELGLITQQKPLTLFQF